MVIFDLYYEIFYMEDYYPHKIHEGTYTAESEEEIKNKVDHLNRRAFWNQSKYDPCNWSYEIKKVPYKRMAESKPFKVGLVVDFSLTEKFVYVDLQTVGVTYEEALAEGRDYVEILRGQKRDTVSLYTFINPNKYTGWLDLYDHELAGAIAKARHHADWAISEEDVRTYTFKKFDEILKDLKERRNQFRYLKY